MITNTHINALVIEYYLKISATGSMFLESTHSITSIMVNK